MDDIIEIYLLNHIIESLSFIYKNLPYDIVLEKLNFYENLREKYLEYLDNDTFLARK